MDRDSTRNTLLVTVGLSVVCALAIAASAIGLRPRQQANAAESIRRAILEAAGIYQPGSGADVNAAFARVETRTIDLATGGFIDPAERPDLAGSGYDALAAARDPALSVAIPDPEDLAGIGRRETAAHVYLVRDETGALEQVVLPVRGKGLFSTLYGFIALAPDAATVRGITFYKHAETPGLGAEVDNAGWKAKWPGKVVSTAPDRHVTLALVKGTADAPDEIDGLSGATLTSVGVTNMVRYWLGPGGFGPFLERLREGQVEVAAAPAGSQQREGGPGHGS
jgi:Na+-transporting NADH:ubiquinone oxidoreductase subunit C